MNEIEQRLRKLKPKVHREIREAILAENCAETPPKKRASSGWSRFVLTCSCSFLLGLGTMYAILAPMASSETESKPQPQQQTEEKPSRFSNDTIAMKQKEIPTTSIRSGKEYAYYTLLKKYQSQ